MTERKVWGTDITWYTVVHRKRHERRCYSFGYRTEDLSLLSEIAQQEADSGEFSCVKIINADSNEDIRYFTKAHK